MNQKILINQDRCIGCSICANTCQQSAIKMINDKAQVVDQDSCDGIGNCLPVCPVSAITFLEEPKKTISLSNNCQSLNPPVNKWPLKIKLVSPNASYLNNCDLAIVADCSLYSSEEVRRITKGKITLIGCPKLEQATNLEKLTTIITSNQINSLTIIKMEVPCCNGISNVSLNALNLSKKNISTKIITISTKGSVLSHEMR